MENLFIDGRDVVISTLRARVSDYTIHDGKIWRVVGSEGAGINYSVNLERETSRIGKENIWVKGKIKLCKIVKPTGYISLK